MKNQTQWVLLQKKKETKKKNIYLGLGLRVFGYKDLDLRILVGW